VKGATGPKPAKKIAREIVNKIHDDIVGLYVREDRDLIAALIAAAIERDRAIHAAIAKAEGGL
jgi:hypothetical protein